MDRPQSVLAHAISDHNYLFEGGYVGVNMHCEHPDGTIRINRTWWPQENLPDIQAYFMSPKGMEPLELVI